MTTIQQLMDMHGRRVLITGAIGALGRMMADTLAELGADLLLIDRPGSDFHKLESELHKKWEATTESICCDLELENDRLELIERVSSDKSLIHCLINNAAFVGTSDLEGWAVPFQEQTIGTWRRAMEVNLTAAFHLSQALTPLLRKADGGNIVNITSIYGEFGPDWSLYKDTTMANPAAYSASKGGLVQLTRWLATTIAPDVRVNAISPGGVYRNQPEVFVERYQSHTPLGRMATNDDFRGAIAYLASDLSQYVTGEILHVDGGWGQW
ncbi:MAG: short-chain dehydrogenase [Rhodospirillaceae bacterium]|jgi:NAD(P)-dependent dehydrogenase (short-subunit alcohol dehydrogenase family)|nr:short-chain dehydrogenase [Rhodospirillaceae bacterium]|tara:strand:+ start:9157 stop:9960 length:804 start_codon:yes stop_codon:yes gene_type:complete